MINRKDQWVLWLKSALKKNAPESVIHALKKAYYPWLLRHFPEDRWPLSAVVKHLIQPGDIVIDAGANIGYVTLLLSRWVGRSGKVISFEPIPQTFDLLYHNTRRLRLRNVTAINLGLSSASGTVRMRIPSDKDGSGNYYEASIVDAHRDQEAGSGTMVEVGRLDGFLPVVPEQLSFIKIDVEGHELEVLQGSERILRSVKPALLVEINGHPDMAGSKTHRLFDLLTEMEYTAYHCRGGMLQKRVHGETPGDCFFLQPRHLNRLKELPVPIIAMM